MAFRFALQRALDDLLEAERSARTILVDARRTCDTIELGVTELDMRLAEMRASHLIRRAAVPCAELVVAEASSVALASALCRREGEAARARSMLSRARALYDDVTRRRAGLERLRARRYEAYRARARRIDDDEFDEANRLASRAIAPAAGEAT